jgi:osmotically-inducible protein OsmY
MVATNQQIGHSADDDLARRVINYLHSKGIRALREVSVEASRGAVLMRGTVSSFYEKQLCLNCTRRVAGVIELVDEIAVRETANATLV